MKQQEMVKKVLFTINLHSMVDIITNSSSELFVGNADSKQEIIKLIETIYPNYLDEYEEVKYIDELTNSEFEDSYLIVKYDLWDDNILFLAKKFNLDPKIIYSNLDKKDNEKYWYPELSDKGIEMIKDKIDPNRKMYFLFSINDNPNWDMQEELMNVMEKYHLG